MYGNQAQVNQPRPTAAAAGPVVGVASGQDMTDEHKGIIATFLTFLVAYVVWAVVERQDSVESAVKPENMAVNVRNILLLTFTAILGINLAKVLTLKMVGWGIPGAKSIAAFVGAA